jgi:hypothetical protein
MDEKTIERPVPLVDARASRFAQGLTASLVVLALATARWALLVLPLAHLLSSLLVGRRGNVALVGFDALLKPRLGAGEQKDARPPRFANLVGAVFLLGAIGAHLAGLTGLGWALAAIVAILAGLAAATGFCLGCKIYVLYKHFQPHLHHRTDPKHAG